MTLGAVLYWAQRAIATAAVTLVVGAVMLVWHLVNRVRP